MNRNVAITIAVACTAAAASAFAAGDITIDPTPFVSTLTRAQVRDELAGFRGAGVNPWADDYDHLAHTRGTLTRAQVKSEFLADRNAAEAFSGEDSGSMYLARGRTAPHRATELAHAE